MNFNIKGNRYKVKNTKGYPLDNKTAKIIISMRLSIINMKYNVKNYNARLKVKEDKLNEVYDQVIRGFKRAK